MKTKPYVLSIIASTVFSLAVHSQTIQVSGEIDASTTWEADLVQVTGDVHIARFATLTIPAGTRVEFQGHYQIRVDGAILANGAPGDTIVFTINDPTGFGNTSTTDGSWLGIRFNDGYSGYDNTDTSYFTFCRIEYTKYINDLSNWLGAGISVIYNYEVVITNSVFENNYSKSKAGGITSFGSELIIRDNLFRNCEGYKGGAIASVRGFPVVENNTIINNRASYGAGIFGRDSNMKIRVNIIRNNQSTVEGGALYYEGTDGQVLENEITFNSAGGDGGAIYYTENSNAAIIGNFIANNQAGSDGGAFYSEISNPLLVNNGIFNNTAGTAGGALYLQDFNSILLNNSIAYNYGMEKAGGIYLQLSSPTLYNTLIWLNYAPQGWQIYIQDQFSDPDFYSCDLYGGLADIFIESGTYNGVFHNSFDMNPGFISTPVSVGAGYDASLANWNLQNFSPCINAGEQEDLPLSLPDADLEGKDRIIHGIVDIGALEALNENFDACGSISGNTTWAADTVFVTCNVTVQDDVTLTVAPGTCVMIGEQLSIQVDGTILAEGTASEPICFTVSDTGGFTDPEVFDGGWAGILFDNESLGGSMYNNDTSVFRNCLIEYTKGKGAIQCIRYSGVVVDQCHFRNNSGSHGGGIYGYFANLRITNSLFEKNRVNDLYPAEEANSLHFEFSSPLIRNNQFRDNYESFTVYANSCNSIRIAENLLSNSMEGYGIYIRSSHGTHITGNRVFNSSSGGISMFKGSHYLANNLVCNNQSIGISLVECDPSILVNNTVCNNAGYGLSFYSTELYAYNNIISGNSNNLNSSGVLYGSNNLLSDPRFRSPTDGMGMDYPGWEADWSLQPISPAIDMGTLETGGAELPQTDLAGNQRVWNERIDIGAYENQGGPPQITRQPSNAIACSGDNVTLFVQASDTAFYQWEKNGTDIPGANDPTLEFTGISMVDQGNYSCRVSNAFGTTQSNPAYVLVNLKPEMLAEPSSDVWLQKDKNAQLRVDVSGSAPLSYQWQKDGGDIPGAVSPELKISSAGYQHEGEYSCLISNTCGILQSSPFLIYIAPEICMVTVDEQRGKNLVVWEKNSIAPIDRFNIYRESSYSGIFDLIGTVPFEDLSVFTDSVADPTIQAYLYKITGVDENGMETDPDLCKTHKTIHLLATINPENGATQLAWDRYVGFEYGSYDIWRADSTLSFSVVFNKSASSSTWTDPDTGPGVKYYRIAAVRQDTCFPSGNTKAGVGPYTHSLSNLDDNKLKETFSGTTRDAGELLIYPNPMSESAVVQFPNPSRDRYILFVRDITGKLVYRRDDVFSGRIELRREDLARGLHLIELRGPSLFRGKILIE